MRRGFTTRPPAPLVLPAVYDDVLSYEEWLSKVIYAINDLQDYINETMENIEEIIEQTVDNKLVPVKSDISAIKVRLNTIDTKIEQIDADIKKTYDRSVAYTNQETKKIYKKYDVIVDNIQKLLATYRQQLEHALEDVETSLENQIREKDLWTLKEAKRYTHHVIGVNNNKIYAEIEKLSEHIDEVIKEYPELYDPATGRMEHMQDLVYNMYRALRTFGIPAMLYDDQLITAEEFDGMGLGAQEYDTSMVWRLWHNFKCMFNPVTGKQESLADIVNFLFTTLRWNGKTVKEFDDYQATAEQLENSTYNAWEQDNSKYYTQPAVDEKNKAYRNWQLVAQDPEGITTVDITGKDYSEYSVVFGEDGMFTFPAADGTYVAPNTSTITIANNSITFTGSPIILYGVNYVTDITELDN